MNYKYYDVIVVLHSILHTILLTLWIVKYICFDKIKQLNVFSIKNIINSK